MKFPALSTALLLLGTWCFEAQAVLKWFTHGSEPDKVIGSEKSERNRLRALAEDQDQNSFFHFPKGSWDGSNIPEAQVLTGEKLGNQYPAAPWVSLLKGMLNGVGSAMGESSLYDIKIDQFSPGATQLRPLLDRCLGQAKNERQMLTCLTYETQKYIEESVSDPKHNPVGETAKGTPDCKNYSSVLAKLIKMYAAHSGKTLQARPIQITDAHAAVELTLNGETYYMDPTNDAPPTIRLYAMREK